MTVLGGPIQVVIVFQPEDYSPSHCHRAPFYAFLTGQGGTGRLSQRYFRLTYLGTTVE